MKNKKLEEIGILTIDDLINVLNIELGDNKLYTEDENVQKLFNKIIND